MRSILTTTVVGLALAVAAGATSGTAKAATASYFQTDSTPCVDHCTLTYTPPVPSTVLERDIVSITCTGTTTGNNFSGAIGRITITTPAAAPVTYYNIHDTFDASEVNGTWVFSFVPVGPETPLRVTPGATVRIIFDVSGAMTVTCTMIGFDQS